MAHHNVVFPESWGYGSDMGPSYSTLVVETEGGQEQRFGRWEQARRRYRLTYADRRPDYVYDVMEFFLARRGSLHSFLFKDPTDYTSASDGISAHGDDVLIGTGDSSDTTFQLVKKYTDSGGTTTRNIRFPITGTVRVYLDGVEQLSGWTVDTTTGIVTFTSAPGTGVEVSAGFTFYVPVRFDEGTDNDGLRTAVTNYNNHQLESLELVEVLYEDTLTDDQWYGGSSERTINGPHTLSKADGLVQTFFNSGASGVDIFAPDPANLAPGGPHFVLIIGTGSSSVDLFDHNPTIMKSGVNGNSVVEYYVSINNSNVKRWDIVEITS